MKKYDRRKSCACGAAGLRAVSPEESRKRIPLFCLVSTAEWSIYCIVCASVCNAREFSRMTDYMPTRLFLLRHGPASAPPGCFAGSSDVPLSGRGLARLENISAQLKDIACWYCSPMLRARQTLEYLQRKGCSAGEPVSDERLREIDFGRWELKTFTDIAAQDKELLAAWNQQYLDFVFPEGEAVAAFIERVKAMLTLFSGMESNTDTDTDINTGTGTVAVVTHGGVIRTMICLALGISPHNYLLFDVQPASLTVLDLFSEGGVLHGLNL
ncbi:MAG: histidine phosphatase family protein [Candidatus Electrothrix sp. LOE2]|nr:histidine phosphatase family protein [Candidatus Electrothrix sp. LOE2]